MANMTFKANLLPNSTSLEYSLGSETNLWKIYGMLTRPGVSKSWNKGRDGAVAGTTSISGYSPAFTIKTTNGSWDIGAYNSTNYTDDLVFSYVSDSLYNGTNTTPPQIKFLENGHIVATLDGSATSLTTSGTTAQFYRGDQTWSNEISGGLLKITNNSNTVTIGSANSSWCHFNNSADIPFYFGNAMSINGNLNPYGTTNTRNLGNSSNRWKTLYIGTADGYGDATTPIYWSAGVPTAGTKYAGGTAVTLNGASKAGSTASFYAPTASGTADTQALLSKGANTAPAWTNISPSITITAGTASATPKVNVTVLGQSGTAQSITTASTSVYGCTKLTSSYTSTDSTLAATGAAIAAAIGTLDVSSVGGTGKYISAISQTDGKISATATSTSVSNAWTAGTTAGPKIATTVNGVTGTAVAIPTATASASGAVTTGAQTWAGNKTFQGEVHLASNKYQTDSTCGLNCHNSDIINLNGIYTSDDATSFNEGYNFYRDGTNWDNFTGHSGAFYFTANGTAAQSIAAVNARATIYCGTVAARAACTKGTAPSSTQGQLWAAYDAAGSAAANRLGMIYAYAGTDAIGHIRMYAYDYVSGSTDTTYLGLYKTSDNIRRTETNARIYGAVWNDYAECRELKENIEPGRCVTEVGDDTMVLTEKRLQRGCKIVSDTFGFCIGETKTATTPIAVSGRALVYLYEDREMARKYIGWPVCSGPNGTVSIMTEEEEEKYPSRIVGTISAIPDYEIWQAGGQEDNDKEPIKVNGRIWIYVR